MDFPFLCSETIHFCILCKWRHWIPMFQTIQYGVLEGRALFRTKHKFVVHHTEYAVSLWGLGFLNVAYFPYYITIAWANIIWLSLPWESWDLGSQAHADPLGIVVVTSNKVRLLWTRNLNVFLNEFISIISFFSSLLCNSYQVSPTPSQIYSLFYFNYYCYTHT